MTSTNGFLESLWPGNRIAISMQRKMKDLPSQHKDSRKGDAQHLGPGAVNIQVNNQTYGQDHPVNVGDGGAPPESGPGSRKRCNGKAQGGRRRGWWKMRTVLAMAALLCAVVPLILSSILFDPVRTGNQYRRNLTAFINNSAFDRGELTRLGSIYIQAADRFDSFREEVLNSSMPLRVKLAPHLDELIYTLRLREQAAGDFGRNWVLLRDKNVALVNLFSNRAVGDQLCSNEKNRDTINALTAEVQQYHRALLDSTRLMIVDMTPPPGQIQRLQDALVSLAESGRCEYNTLCGRFWFLWQFTTDYRRRNDWNRLLVRLPSNSYKEHEDMHRIVEYSGARMVSMLEQSEAVFGKAVPFCRTFR